MKMIKRTAVLLMSAVLMLAMTAAPSFAESTEISGEAHFDGSNITSDIFRKAINRSSDRYLFSTITFVNASNDSMSNTPHRPAIINLQLGLSCNLVQFVQTFIKVSVPL